MSFASSSNVGLYVQPRTGNVGIGTTLPLTGLHVCANTASAGCVIDQAGAGGILDIRDAGVSKVIVDANGNVGIGTTISNQKLDVLGNINLLGDVYTNGVVCTAPTGQISHFAMKTAPAGWLACDGSTLSRVAYNKLFTLICPSLTFTVTIASPAVFTTSIAHGYSAGDVLYFTTTGALPTGLTAGTTAYYVISTGLTTTSFRVSTSSGGAAVNTSGTQSGVHTVYNAPFGFGNGSTTFTLPDLRGEFLRGWDNGRGVDSGRVIGISQIDSMQDHRHYMGTDGNASGGYSQAGTGNQSGNSGYNNNTTSTPIPTTLGGTTIRTATETRPRNIATLACIKY